MGAVAGCAGGGAGALACGGVVVVGAAVVVVIGVVVGVVRVRREAGAGGCAGFVAESRRWRRRMGGLVLVKGLVRELEGGSDRFRLCRRLGRRLGMRAPCSWVVWCVTRRGVRWGRFRRRTRRLESRCLCRSIHRCLGRGFHLRC